MRFIGGLFSLGVYGFFAGVLVVLSIFWWHGRDLKSTVELAQYEPATLSRVYAADGAVMAEFALERRLFTPVDEIPDLVKHAFISAEDRNFYAHSGVDGVGLLKATVDNVRRVMDGRRLRGASTITMQVVKNFLLSGERELSRKIQELLLAQRLETALSKDQILELYLNEIFLGVNSYGVTSAADRYFRKRLEDLTIEEAAYLAALPKAPSNLHPVRNKAYATDRRDYVLREMRENGYIDIEQFEKAIATPLLTVLDDPALGGDRLAPPPDLDYFAEEIRRQLIAERGADQVLAGGLAIRATMDPQLQTIARDVLQDRLLEFSMARGYGGPVARLEDLDPALAADDDGGWRSRLDALETAPRGIADWRLATVLLVGERSAQIGVEGVESDAPIYLMFSDVQPWARRRTGVDERGDAVLGPELSTPADVWDVGDVIYVREVTAEDGETQWSMREIPDVNGALVAMDPRTGRVLALQGGFSHKASEFNRATQAKRQPGSAFKPFVYAAALEHGYDPNSVVLDSPITLEQPDGTLWKPRNYSGQFYGAVPLRWGIEKSHNLMTVRLALDVGLETVAQYAETFGVYEDMPPLVSYALGAGETSLLKLAASYAMFVNGGKRIEPTLIDRIQDRRGATVFRHDQRICAQCRAPAYVGQAEPYVPDEGEQVINPITAYQVVSMMEGVTIRGTASKIGAALEFPVAGKTGTTNEARDAWFVGFTNDMVVGCFIGFDAPAPMGRKQSGGKLCGPVFQNFVSRAQSERPPSAFRQPSDAILVKINRHSGCAVPEYQEGADVIWEAFTPERAPYVGECPEGGIAGLATSARNLGGASAVVDDASLTGPSPQLGAVEPLTGQGGPETPLDADLQAIGVRGGVGGAARPGNREAPGSAPQRPQPDAVIGGGSGGLY